MDGFFFQISLFVLSTFALVKSAAYFVASVERIGTALRVPHFITGVLVVSIGTSLPELATGIAAVLKGETDMLVGNVLGSNISNIFLGLGLVSVLARKHITFKQNIFYVHFPILIISVCLIMLSLIGDHQIVWQEGLLYIGVLGAYLWFLFSKEDSKRDWLQHEDFRWTDVFIAVLALVILTFSSDVLIESIIRMAELLSLSTTSLAATLVAVGTSLPEMMVVYSSLKRGNFELAVGNILGSNIFNILLIAGVGSFIAPLVVSELTINVMLPFTLGSLLVYWGASKDNEITQQEGLAMTALYVLFISQLFGWF